MAEARPILTSLEVGFSNDELPAKLAQYRGRATRRIPLAAEFPFEDAQFDVVMMDGAAVSRDSVREAHRVLKREGRLYFIVPEKTKKQSGWTIPDVYAVVRDGFNILQAERPAWWFFGRKPRTLTICAGKKNWREYKSFVRNRNIVFSPFEER